MPLRPRVDLTAKGIEEFAAKLLRGEGLVIYHEVPECRLELFGREIVLKNLKVGCERTVLADPEGMARMIEELPGEQIAGMLRPNGGRFFTAFMSDFVEDSNRGMPVVGWDIPELREMEEAGRPELGVNS